VILDNWAIVPPPAREVGMRQILKPVACPDSLKATDTIRVVIRNFGGDTLFAIPFNYRYDNNAPVLATPFVYTTPLPPAAEATVTLPAIQSPLPPGTYTLKVFTQLSGDPRVNNDTITRCIIKAAMAAPDIGIQCIAADTLGTPVSFNNNNYRVLGGERFRIFICLKNYGLRSIVDTLIPITLRVGFFIQTTFVRLIDTLRSGEMSVNEVLMNNTIIAPFGWFNLNVISNLNNDDNSSNDSASVIMFGEHRVLCLPTLFTNPALSVGIDSVVIGGDILNDGGSSIVLRGICYSTTPNPNMGNPRTEEGSGIGSFTSTLRNLSPSTTYYARSYAKNSQGVVVYGNEVSFSTSTPVPSFLCGTSTVTDVDGNNYNTVQIGNQCWTQSNLKVSKYRNGDNIPTGLSNSSWGGTTSGAYAIYNNDPVNDGLYGKLYNHFAVTDTRGLCPTGWHVPTDGEFTKLVKYLDPMADSLNNWSQPQSFTAGGALKSIQYWNSPNIGGTNSSGFSAVPGGHRAHTGTYYASLNERNHIWSSTISSNGIPWLRALWYNNNGIYRANVDFANGGFSVRCLRDVIPTVSTSTVLIVTATSAITGGNVSQDGGASITARGVAYGTSATPTTSGTITTDGTGTGVFTSTLTGLMPSTTYYERAYATNSVGTAYGNEVSFTTAPLSIGSSYAGGIVFDLDSTGQHGLVCAPSNQGNFQWGCYGTDIPNTSTAVGTGATNTASIMAGCTQRPIAASVCADLVLNGYSDWYLPSLGELQLMYSRLRIQGLGGFGNSAHWSSSQGDPNFAWTMNFNGGYVGSYFKYYGNQIFNIQVRAVRSF